jgi:GTP cyclohydrolase I
MLKQLERTQEYRVNGDGFDLGIKRNNGFHKDSIIKHGWVAVPTEDDAIQAGVRTILANVGEDPDRDGLVGTPDRIARMYDEVLGGYRVDPIEVVNGALFDVDYNDMVLVRDIEFFSMCEHHMLPFFGVAHVAYIPGDKVIGLSKIPRLVEMFARRLQVQERLTHQVANMLSEIVGAQGVAVAVEGQHMCSMMRGVKKEQATMFTTSFLGQFESDRGLRSEFMNLVS